MSQNQARRAQRRHMRKWLHPGNKGTPGPGRALMRSSRVKVGEGRMNETRSLVRIVKRKLKAGRPGRLPIKGVVLNVRRKAAT